MRIRTHHHAVHTVDVDGQEFEVEHQPAYENYIIAKPVGDDHMVIGYLVYDHDYRSPDDLMGDCMGRLLSFERSSKDIQEGYEALGMDSYGERNWALIWDRHEDEVVRRYSETVLRVHGAEDVAAEFEEGGEYERRDGESIEDTAKRYLQCDIDEQGYRWGDAKYHELLGGVLEQMFDEPEYFPGNADAVLLDVYDHSGRHWSISGGGMQCRWDTSRGAGVWVPGEYLTKELDSAQHTAVWAQVRDTRYLRGTGKQYQLVKHVWVNEKEVNIESVAFSDDYAALRKQAQDIAAMSPTPTAVQLRWGRQKAAENYCQSFLDEYNAICSGDVYGCVVEAFKRIGEDEWEQVAEDSCWGFVTSEYAMEALESDFVNPTVKSIEKEFV